MKVAADESGHPEERGLGHKFSNWVSLLDVVLALQRYLGSGLSPKSSALTYSNGLRGRISQPSALHWYSSGGNLRSTHQPYKGELASLLYDCTQWSTHQPSMCYSCLRSTLHSLTVHPLRVSLPFLQTSSPAPLSSKVRVQHFPSDTSPYRSVGVRGEFPIKLCREACTAPGVSGIWKQAGYTQPSLLLMQSLTLRSHLTVNLSSMTAQEVQGREQMT